MKLHILVFGHLISYKKWSPPHPLHNVRKFSDLFKVSPLKRCASVSVVDLARGGSSTNGATLFSFFTFCAYPPPSPGGQFQGQSDQCGHLWPHTCASRVHTGNYSHHYVAVFGFSHSLSQLKIKLVVQVRPLCVLLDSSLAPRW